MFSQLPALIQSKPLTGLLDEEEEEDDNLIFEEDGNKDIPLPYWSSYAFYSCGQLSTE